MDGTGRTIGALARDAAIHVETVRYYERRGILKQPARGRGWRRYDEGSLRTVCFVKRAQELGFTLDEVQELLALRSSASARTCERARTRATAKLVDVEVRLRDLTAIRDALAQLTRACPTEGAAYACPILHALDTNGDVTRG